MPLDQFKTQVLLLHSEQNALDSLSSGFGDRYTVHCATSGAEALTTLGETPINVIISAQKLPGMSGVEALREAKKRSPETIGILLASAGSEAIVGDKEVFQVVHGDVTSEGLKKLVDSATQQMRLMALAESANDTAANMDEPAEHIIMETSENGSTIISDGTGRFPALRPDKVAAETATGTRSVDVLVLTKDQEFLTTIRESSRGMHNVHYANTLKQADEAIREHKVGVAVVDAAMVGEKVEQLTLHLRKGSPRLVAIVAGRRDDGEMLMDLINRGKVYRFLLKPVSPGRARLAVEASIKHHLEAPDSAFKTSGASAPAPRPQPAAKPPAKPAAEQKPAPAPKPSAPPAAQPKATPKPAAAPAPAAKAAASAPARKPAPERADPPLGEPTPASPVNDRLGDAFGGDDSSFTDTMTGIIGAVGKRFGSGKEKGAAAAVASDTAGGSRMGKPVIFGIGAIVVVAVAGTLFWMMSGDEPEQPPVEPAATVSPSITEADFTFESPTEEPVDTQALVDEALAEVEAALLESRLDEATAALQQVAELDPDNARLPFLTAQLKQIQLRTYLAGARNAIRDRRFEDASNLIASARGLELSDQAEIGIVANELAAARSEQRVDETLALAAARLEEGDLLAPVNDNARYYYELVLSNAPDNTSARQGLDVIASKLVFQARTEIDNGNLDAAEELLGSASAINPSSSDLVATTAALQSARDAVAERERRAAEARRREEADRIAAAQREEEQRRAAAEAKAEADRQAAAQQAAAQQAPVDVPAADAAATTPAAGAVADDAGAVPDQVDAGDQAAATAAADTQQQQATTVIDRPVAISSLTRTRYVAPKYPRAAERRGDSGWVDVVFTLTVDGTVKDVGVRGSTPEGVFDRAAVRAVEKWEFEPVIENGQAVEKRAGVRMMFALE